MVENISSPVFDPKPHQDHRLQDLRLHRASKVWLNFKEIHFKQLSDIANLSAEEVCKMANELSSEVSVVVGSEYEPNAVWISPNKLEELCGSVCGDGNRVIFQRHGEQSPPEWIFSMPQDTRKVRMMQNPFNAEDLLTNKSIAEVFSTALALSYVLAKSGKSLQIFSSENSRALEVAKIVSDISGNSGISFDEGLNCITYKDERDGETFSLEELLSDLPQGTMPLVPDLIDKWCKSTRSGLNASLAIEQSIEKIHQLGQNSEGNNLYIVLTHSQQLSEAMRLSAKLQDNSFRLPELSMIIVGPDIFKILSKGVLPDSREGSKKVIEHDIKKHMTDTLEKIAGPYELYKVRRDEYKHDKEKIPFRVSPEPLELTTEEKTELMRIGQDVTAYVLAADELYRQDERVSALLKVSPPDFFDSSRTNYLFVRPDLLITDKGFTICEIETSPFGLGLADMLNRAYSREGFETMVGEDKLRKFLADSTPAEGTIIYTSHTQSYEGQLKYLANEVFSGTGRNWEAEHVNQAFGKDHASVYRGFYLYESSMFLRQMALTMGERFFPSWTPHMEEKGLLALIWDRRFEGFFRNKLGDDSFGHLRQVIPPTWIMGQEEFFASGFPGNLKSSTDLASLSKTKREFVLKRSGFGEGSSWGEGVSFLHEKSGKRAGQILAGALNDDFSSYIIQ